MKQTRYLITLILLCVCFLSACGQTGKLYLPPTSTTAPETRE